MIYQFLDPNVDASNSCRNLMIISMVVIILKVLTVKIPNSDTLLDFFPMLYLPQQSVMSFAITWFILYGVHITLGVLFWLVSYLLILYAVKITTWKDEVAISVLKKCSEEFYNIQTQQLDIFEKGHGPNNDVEVADKFLKKFSAVQIEYQTKIDAYRDKLLKKNNWLIPLKLYSPLLVFIFAWLLSFTSGINLLFATQPLP